MATSNLQGGGGVFSPVESCLVVIQLFNVYVRFRIHTDFELS